MAIDKEHLFITIGGVLASAGIAYVIYRMQASDAAQNTDATIEASEDEAQQEQSYISSLPTISQPAPSASTTYSSSGDISTASESGGTSATDDELEQLIAGFQSNPNNSVVLQSTPVAQLAALPAPPQTTVAPVIVPQLDINSTPSQGTAIISQGIGSNS